jgi:ADP-heptose:LPS heptosyltransferase
MKATAPALTSQADLAMIDQLRRRDFDAAVIFTVYSQSPLPAALLCYLADIPLRLAYCRENPYQLLTDWVHEVEPEQYILHEVQRHLNLVEAIDCPARSLQMSFLPSPSDRQQMNAILQEAGVIDSTS